MLKALWRAFVNSLKKKAVSQKKKKNAQLKDRVQKSDLMAKTTENSLGAHIPI